jgi:tRNA-splicing ligase RtcB
MKKRELLNLGIPAGEPLQAALAALRDLAAGGARQAVLRATLQAVVEHPQNYRDDATLGPLARALIGHVPTGFTPRAEPAPWRQWGQDLDEKSLDQMRQACALPIAVAGALMPDAHVGYGLPIGGVLATANAVIPYAVGVDIACRMKLTVLDLPTGALTGQAGRLKNALERETSFGVGATFRQPRQHDVMDRDWSVSPVTRELRDKAWHQLGTSGSGNHFVEFGQFTLDEPQLGLPAGEYLALLSHSGSRGTGAAVCAHYSRIAQDLHRDLPRELHHLAWLDLDSQPGQEYWAAMELMGEYAAANHACIHRHIAQALGAKVLLDVENHHNFAWRETHFGRDVVVHRKGATPAAAGVLGIIPGSMATPGYLVRGKGQPESLTSASHGAGRAMSRSQALKTYRWKDARELLERAGVTLLSAGLDEVPMVYKDIHGVMQAQRDLVEVLGRFDPKLVKMAPAGERAED